MKKHKYANRIENEYKCDHCDYKTNIKRSLKNHDCKHENQRSQCIDCSKIFMDETALNNHKSQLHEQCLFSRKKCEQTFTNETTVKKHQDTHKSAPDYKCSICRSAFKTADNLRTHIDSKYVQTRITCDQCGFVFKSQDNLKTHTNQTHIGTDYVCDRGQISEPLDNPQSQLKIHLEYLLLKQKL